MPARPANLIAIAAHRHRPLRTAIRVALAASLTALACAGCSFGPKVTASATNLRVTGAFGTHTYLDAGVAATHPRETDLQALEARTRITTVPGATVADDGPAVTSIGGRSASAGGQRWFFYLNGVEPTKSAAAFTVNKGDHFWWDLHAAGSGDKTQAVVGSFPEPFLNGLFGRRYPATRECGAGMTAACAAITAEFTHFHIPLSPAGPGYGSGTDSLSINVGTWRELRGEVVAGLIEKGPDASGVYVHFIDGGHRMQLENEAGHVVRTLGTGTGLIAATAGPSDVPTWVVTGTDPAGVLAAAHAVTTASLAGHFALVVQGAHHYPIPVAGTS